MLLKDLLKMRMTRERQLALRKTSDPANNVSTNTIKIDSSFKSSNLKNEDFSIDEWRAELKKEISKAESSFFYSDYS